MNASPEERSVEYQINAHEKQVEVGQGEESVAVLRKTGWFVFNLGGDIDGQPCTMRLPAPWTGFRWRLEHSGRELASAKRERIRQRKAVYELELPGRLLKLENDDRHGLRFVLTEGDEECGALQLRPFDEQERWQADLEAPPGWSVPLAAFVGWLAQQARVAID